MFFILVVYLHSSVILILHFMSWKYLPAFFLSLLLFGFCGFAQTVPSPESFLGYSLGAHFTPHYKVINYFKAVAAAAPERMLLEQYGSTYEGRPLELAYIASPENLRRLDAIRQNNLRLAGMLHDSTAADEHAPVIVWL